MQQFNRRIFIIALMSISLTGCREEYYRLKEFTECYAYCPDGPVFIQRDELVNPSIDNGTKVRVLRDGGDLKNFHRPVEIIVVEGPKSGLSGTVARQYLRVP